MAGLSNVTRKLIVASNNRHKLDEIRAILGDAWTVLGAADVAPGISWDETGQTFLDNARIKVNALRRHTKDCVLADDSGLCVDALDGKPGVHSSSYGGVEGDHQRNVDHLLSALKDVPLERRGAHFYCLLLFVNEEGIETRFEGRCEGHIANGRSGQGGFGYDPVFVPEGSDVSMAEMGDARKNAISHRGRAMGEFIKVVR
jgi:XTP/dITP diphosphohydrolase